MAFRDKPAYANLLSSIEQRVAELLERQRSSKAAEGSFEQVKLKSELDPIQKILKRLDTATTERQVVDIYYDSKGLMFPDPQTPTTSGEDEAGRFLAPRVGATADALGIALIAPPEPAPKGSRKRT